MKKLKVLFVTLSLLLLLGFAAAFAAAPPTRLFVVEGLQAPESAVFDADQDLYFVSNINGEGTAKDNNGFISKVSPEGKIDQLKFIEGGSKGVVLNGPKGLALSGDLLWVADIDVVRAFDRKTGVSRKNVDLAPLGAAFLNDVTVAPDGFVYVTDSGLHFDDKGNSTHPGPDRLYRISDDGTVKIVVDDMTINGPNGVVWDAEQKQFLIASLNGKNLYSWSPQKKLSVYSSGVGGFDGIVLLGHGRLLVSSLDASGVFLFENGKSTAVITGIETPADISLDARRNRLLIPSFSLNHLEIWQL